MKYHTKTSICKLGINGKYKMQNQSMAEKERHTKVDCRGDCKHVCKEIESRIQNLQNLWDVAIDNFNMHKII